jgi:hypothetical protein
LVDADYSGWRIDEDGVLLAYFPTFRRPWCGTCSASPSTTAQSHHARSETGQAAASRADNRAYSDPSDALFELIDALRLIPGAEEDLELEEDLGLMANGSGSTTSSNGFGLALEAGHGRGGPHWTATFTLSKEEWSATLEVRCEWDALRVPCGNTPPKVFLKLLRTPSWRE